MINIATNLNTGVNTSFEVYLVNAVVRIISIINLIRLSLIPLNKGHAIL